MEYTLRHELIRYIDRINESQGHLPRGRRGDVLTALLGGFRWNERMNNNPCEYRKVNSFGVISNTFEIVRADGTINHPYHPQDEQWHIDNNEPDIETRSVFEIVNLTQPRKRYRPQWPNELVTRIANNGHLHFLLQYIQRNGNMFIIRREGLIALPNQELCPICLEEFNNDKPITTLSCGHTYHSECIVNKLTAGECPMCRQKSYYQRQRATKKRSRNSKRKRKSRRIK